METLIDITHVIYVWSSLTLKASCFQFSLTIFVGIISCLAMIILLYIFEYNGLLNKKLTEFISINIYIMRSIFMFFHPLHLPENINLLEKRKSLF